MVCDQLKGFAMVLYRVFIYILSFLGIRSQREAFKSKKAKTAMDCIRFCFKEENCNSLNYADLNSVGDGVKNCELQSETENEDENDIRQLIKDKRYTFYHRHQSQPKQVPISIFCFFNKRPFKFVYIVYVSVFNIISMNSLKYFLSL